MLGRPVAEIEPKAVHRDMAHIGAPQQHRHVHVGHGLFGHRRGAENISPYLVAARRQVLRPGWQRHAMFTRRFHPLARDDPDRVPARSVGIGCYHCVDLFLSRAKDLTGMACCED